MRRRGWEGLDSEFLSSVWAAPICTLIRHSNWPDLDSAHELRSKPAKVIGAYALCFAQRHACMHVCMSVYLYFYKIVYIYIYIYIYIIHIYRCVCI